MAISHIKNVTFCCPLQIKIDFKKLFRKQNKKIVFEQKPDAKIIATAAFTNLTKLILFLNCLLTLSNATLRHKTESKT